MIHGETQDQDPYNEQKALPADAEPLLGKVDEIVPRLRCSANGSTSGAGIR